MSPSACRSSPSPPTRRCCRRGSRARATRTRSDPYFLYGASNLGSLLALLGYPFVLEPDFGLTALSGYWAMLFVVLIFALGACFVLVRRRAAAVDAPADALPMQREAAAPTWRDRLGWCGLAMVPAALLTAFTTHITTDVASAPLLWVIPLSIYLATFVLAFQTRLPLPMWLLLPAQLAAVDLRAARAGADEARQVAADERRRRRRFLPRGPRRPPHAVPQAAARRAISPSSICGCRSAACSAAYSRR